MAVKWHIGSLRGCILHPLSLSLSFQFETYTLTHNLSNTRWRPCDRISPSQINTTSLTHLILAFASIDPVAFAVTPADPADLEVYKPFTDLQSTTLETWIGIGGGGFTDPGAKTLTTWSDLASSRSGREAFIRSLQEFMVVWGFQGVDLDCMCS